MNRPAAGRLTGLSLLAISIPGAAVPFLDIVREIDRALSESGTVYAIIGGVAASRAGTPRTTGDIDILVDHVGWDRFIATPSEVFTVGPNWLRHVASGIVIDVLFGGDDWDLPFPLPHPGDIRERDGEVGAWFIRPWELVILKAAVHLSKKREYGDATAAKDLSDLRDILAANPGLMTPTDLSSLPREISDLIRRTDAEIALYREKRPRR